MKYIRLHYFILLSTLLALTSCAHEPQQRPTWQQIAGRDDSPTYRARVPSTWRRLDIEAKTDTTTSLCEFFIDAPEGSVRIAVHNFPVDEITDRIPPASQIARWKRQLHLDLPTDAQVIPVSHGGFTGLCLKGCGEKEAIFAWAMQLAPAHFRCLSGPQCRQMRGDYTIKVTGPISLLERHQSAIEAFARSFELLEEIPDLS